MNIVFASDNNYVPYLGVAMMSVLNKHTDAAFHVLDGGISDDNKEKLHSITKDITFYSVDTASLFHGFEAVRDYISIAAFYRFLIPSLLGSSIERCLYLDCDTLVVDSLHDFYNTNLQGCYFAVVEDECGIEQSERLGFDASDYFNSGVMLFNLDELRKFDFLRTCIDFYIAHKASMLLDDQDVLNSLFVSKCKFIPLRYNANSRIFAGKGEMCAASAEEIREAVEEPAIVHFTGDIKPWSSMCRHPFKGIYSQYAAKSPWGNTIEQDSYSKYILYKLLAKLTFGKLRKYCEKGRDRLHGKIRSAREFT